MRSGLARHLTGRTIGGVEVFDPRSLRRQAGGAEEFVRRLSGRTMTAAVRRGKFLWLHLDDGRALSAHLGMSGQLLVRGTGAGTPGRVTCAYVFISSLLTGTLPGALLSISSISAYSVACMSPIWCPRRMAPPVGWAARPPCSPSAPAISPAICSTPRLIVRTS